ASSSDSSPCATPAPSTPRSSPGRSNACSAELGASGISRARASGPASCWRLGREALVHEADDGGALADGGGAALDRAGADVAGGVDAGDAGLQQPLGAGLGAG